MKRIGINGLLSAVILAGILLGAGGSIALNRIVEGYLFEDSLAEESYTIYKDNWNAIKDGKKARLTLNPFHSYPILAADFILGHPRADNIGSFIRGFRRLGTEDYDVAAAYFEKLLNDEARQLGPVALLYYGYCMQKKGRYNEAMQAYLHLDGYFGGKYPEAAYNLAALYSMTGDEYKARQYYARYAELKAAR